MIDVYSEVQDSNLFAGGDSVEGAAAVVEAFKANEHRPLTLCGLGDLEADLSERALRRSDMILLIADLAYNLGVELVVLPKSALAGQTEAELRAVQEQRKDVCGFHVEVVDKEAEWMRALEEERERQRLQDEEEARALNTPSLTMLPM